ncbi:MAG: FAD-dependent oxidoreductase [Rhodospirillaceae bacterium]|nr:FAD-dependent oxidoreductase [Rhodospirillaceae bacterium]
MPTSDANEAGRGGDRGAVTVLGAGIVGTCCALALQREGFSVTLIDRDTPGAGTSSGNAGLIQTGTPMPMATPGMLRQVPAMLLDPKGSLVIRWRYLPRLIPWLWRFVRESSARRTEANARDQMRLLDHVGDAYRELVRAAGAEDMLRYKGLLFVYRGAADARAAGWEMDMFRRHGVRVDTVNADELRQMEPALNRDYTHGFHLPDCFYTVDPKHLTERLAEAFGRMGGVFRKAEVTGIEIGPAGPSGLRTASETIPVERLVLAAGVFSKKFARDLGISVPLESARGYHLMLLDETVRINGPVLDGKRHFAVTPMSGGLRLAGMVELASLEAAPNYERAEMLLPLAQDMLPGLKGAETRPWMGHRPMIPDSLPVIEQSRRHPNTFFAFGHGQLGLTMGAITGLLVADLACGREPRVDLTPYRSDRF